MKRNISICPSGGSYPAFVNFLQSSLRYITFCSLYISYLKCSSYLLGSTSYPVWPLSLTWTVIMENQSWLAENVESIQRNSCHIAKSPVNYLLPSSLFSSSCSKVNAPQTHRSWASTELGIERRLRPGRAGAISAEGSPVQVTRLSGHSQAVLATSAKQTLKSQWM